MIYLCVKFFKNRIPKRTYALSITYWRNSFITHLSLLDDECHFFRAGGSKSRVACGKYYPYFPGNCFFRIDHAYYTRNVFPNGCNAIQLVLVRYFGSYRLLFGRSVFIQILYHNRLTYLDAYHEHFADDYRSYWLVVFG